MTREQLEFALQQYLSPDVDSVEMSAMVAIDYVTQAIAGIEARETSERLAYDVERLTRELAEANAMIAGYSEIACEVGMQRDAARQERDEARMLWAACRADLDQTKRHLASYITDGDMTIDEERSAAEVLREDMVRQRDEAIADNAALRAMMPSEDELRAVLYMRDHGDAAFDRVRAERIDRIDEWFERMRRLSPPSAPAQDAPIDRATEGFCACGRRTSECDRSRKACASSEAS